MWDKVRDLGSSSRTSVSRAGGEATKLPKHSTDEGWFWGSTAHHLLRRKVSLDGLTFVTPRHGLCGALGELADFGNPVKLRKPGTSLWGRRDFLLRSRIPSRTGRSRSLIQNNMEVLKSNAQRPWSRFLLQDRCLRMSKSKAILGALWRCQG